mmetsp:Transcript_76835/g.223082  ORF Transcript_76835/g.223082 Transcript_76835/m.223082 type:complete len:272 (-) Transcript_76835:206-1021(-)
MGWPPPTKAAPPTKGRFAPPTAARGRPTAGRAPPTRPPTGRMAIADALPFGSISTRNDTSSPCCRLFAESGGWALSEWKNRSPAKLCGDTTKPHGFLKDRIVPRSIAPVPTQSLASEVTWTSMAAGMPPSSSATWNVTLTPADRDGKPAGKWSLWQGITPSKESGATKSPQSFFHDWTKPATVSPRKAAYSVESAPSSSPTASMASSPAASMASAASGSSATTPAMRLSSSDSTRTCDADGRPLASVARTNSTAAPLRFVPKGGGSMKRSR